MRQARCSCGQLFLAIEGDPIRVSMCHCRACQRRTGSTFGAQARFPKDQVTISGTSRQYVRTADSGNQITFFFCPKCGSTVYYQLQGVLDALAVPVGAFADPDFPPPKISVYEARKHGWTGIPQDVIHYD